MINMDSNFFMPVRLVTGENCVRSNSAYFAQLGKNCLIVTGRSSAKACGALDDVTAALESQGIKWTVFDKVGQNPTVACCLEGAKLAREIGADFIVGIGGGSPLDASKAIAVYAGDDATVEEAFQGKYSRALPFALVGTTAGTGSEVTQWAILTQDNGHKRTLGGDLCYAKVSFGDPKYTMSLNYKFTVSTALDAISHAIEGYFSSKAGEISDTFALKAIKLLYEVMGEIEGIEAEKITFEQRERLYYGSLYAGFTLNLCGTAFPHPMGYFLTEQRGVSHGVACAVFLPEYIQRGCKFETEKAVRLFDYLGIGAGELCDFIQRLCAYNPEPVSQEEINDMITRWKSTANFDRSPGGRDEAYITQVLGRIYNGGNL